MEDHLLFGDRALVVYDDGDNDHLEASIGGERVGEDHDDDGGDGAVVVYDDGDHDHLVAGIGCAGVGEEREGGEETETLTVAWQPGEGR